MKLDYIKTNLPKIEKQIFIYHVLDYFNNTIYKRIQNELFKYIDRFKR